MMTDLRVVVTIVQVQAVRGEMMRVQALVVMIVQVQAAHLRAAQSRVVHFANVQIDRLLAVPVEMMIVRHVVVMIGQVQAGRVRVGQVLDARVRVDQVLDDQARIARVRVDLSANVQIDRLQAVPVEMMIDLRVVVMIGQVQAGQALGVHTAIVMIDRRAVVTTDPVRVDRVLVDRFVVALIVQIVVAMIAVMFQHVHRLPRNVKLMKFITVPAVASTAKNRCQPPSTLLNVGKMTAR